EGVGGAPTLEVTAGLDQVSLRQIDADGRQPRPCLLAEIKETAGPAADVEQAQAALIASGEQLAERHQRLASGRIGRTLEQHLDLRVVPPRRVRRQPAAGLEMEILQIVVRPLAAGVLAQHLPVMAALPPAMHLREVLEDQA